MPIEICSVTEFIAAAKRHLKDFGTTMYWYRGQAKASWDLKPSVHRRFDAWGEQQLVRRFMLGAPTRYAQCPPLDDRAGWLSLMQQYGLPTRLLDWTASPLVALYFAVDHALPRMPDEDGEDERVYEGMAGSLWVLLPEALNTIVTGIEIGTLVLGEEAVNPLLTGAFEGESHPTVLAVTGRHVDMRMSVQQAAYTIHGDPTPLNQHSSAPEFLVQMVIPSDAKPALRDELWALGIKRAALFPDLANLAEQLKFDERVIPHARSAASGQRVAP